MYKAPDHNHVCVTFALSKRHAAGWEKVSCRSQRDFIQKGVRDCTAGVSQASVVIAGDGEGREERVCFVCKGEISSRGLLGTPRGKLHTVD